MNQEEADGYCAVHLYMHEPIYALWFSSDFPISYEISNSGLCHTRRVICICRFHGQWFSVSGLLPIDP